VKQNSLVVTSRYSDGKQNNQYSLYEGISLKVATSKLRGIILQLIYREVTGGWRKMDIIISSSPKYQFKEDR
jgi:hypothetical protein